MTTHAQIVVGPMHEDKALPMNQRGPTGGGQDHCCTSIIYNLYKFGLDIREYRNYNSSKVMAKNILGLRCYWQGFGIERLALSLVIDLVTMNLWHSSVSIARAFLIRIYLVNDIDNFVSNNLKQ